MMDLLNEKRFGCLKDWLALGSWKEHTPTHPTSHDVSSVVGILPLNRAVLVLSTYDPVGDLS